MISTFESVDVAVSMVKSDFVEWETLPDGFMLYRDFKFHSVEWLLELQMAIRTQCSREVQYGDSYGVYPRVVRIYYPLLKQEYPIVAHQADDEELAITAKKPKVVFKDADPEEVIDTTHFVDVCLKHANKDASGVKQRWLAREIRICAEHCKTARTDGGALITNRDFITLILFEVQEGASSTSLKALFDSKPAHITFMRDAHLLGHCLPEQRRFLEDQLNASMKRQYVCESDDEDSYAPDYSE